MHFSNDRVYHISEDANISTFEPRPNRTGIDKVWAISANKLQNYFLPRDCPRICIWQNKDTTNADAKLLGKHKSLIYIETQWLKRARDARLFAYVFTKSGFKIEDENAGYFTATRTQKPEQILPISAPLDHLASLNCQLISVQSLSKIKSDILQSSFAFSMIRLGNLTQPTQT